MKPVIHLRWEGSGPYLPTRAAATPFNRDEIERFGIDTYAVTVISRKDDIRFTMTVGRQVVTRREAGADKQYFQFMIQPEGRVVRNVVLIDPWYLNDKHFDSMPRDIPDHIAVAWQKQGGRGFAFAEKTQGWLYERGRRGHPLRKRDNGSMWELEITDEYLHDRELWYLEHGHYCTEFDDCKVIVDWFNDAEWNVNDTMIET